MNTRLAGPMPSMGPLFDPSGTVFAGDTRLLPFFGLVRPASAHLDNVLATPHLGYVSAGLYRTFYEDCVSNILQWLARL